MVKTMDVSIISAIHCWRSSHTAIHMLVHDIPTRKEEERRKQSHILTIRLLRRTVQKQREKKD
jgi:hypothetical protein